MKQLVLLLWAVGGLCLFAQTSDHYVVKTTGDTLFGSLKYKSGDDMRNKITIKVDDTTKVTLKASEVKYVKDGKDEYITFEPEGEKESYFLRIWVKGYLELYEWQVPSTLSNSSKIEYIPYFRKRGDKDLIELFHKDWKYQLAEVMDDYEELARDVEKGKYHMEDMGDAVKAYNEWREGDAGDDD